LKNLRPGIAALLLVCCAVLFTGCGNNYYADGRALPPSGVANRVLVAVQNPSAYSGGALYFDDAYYDVRHNISNSIPQFSISGYAGKLPVTIQNMPEEQIGAVYASGDGSFTTINYQTEKVGASISGLSGLYPSSVFLTRNQRRAFAASPSQHVFTVVDNPTSGGSGYSLNLPNAYRVSINPGGTIALIFLQDSNSIYYLYQLQANQAAPSNAYDCEPQNNPQYCVLPLAGTFDRPVKAVFSSDGSSAYILNCGPECGGTTASVSVLPVSAALIESGSVVPPNAPTQVEATISVPGGAYNALVTGNAIYIAGQQKQASGTYSGLFAGNLSIFNPATLTVTNTYSISDGFHGKMILGDDNTLWIGSTLCNEGVRFAELSAGTNTSYGCLTMFNTSTNAVTLDSYNGDLTGIAAVTGLHKVYVAEGGQVYIYSTVNMAALDNEYVTVTGTAYDVAYMDALTDSNNTTY
jgi:hypothetical protein